MGKRSSNEDVKNKDLISRDLRTSVTLNYRYEKYSTIDTIGTFL